QRMNDDDVDAPVARPQHCVVEQPGAVAAATGALHDGDAELGAVVERRVPLERRLVGEVCQRDQLQAPVEDAKDFVALELDVLDVASDLLVGGGVAKSKVAVTCTEREQVRKNPRLVARG